MVPHSLLTSCGDSPGLIDIQINGAYGFDFSIYDGDDAAYMAGLQMISRRIVETGVTRSVLALFRPDAEIIAACCPQS